MSDYLKDEIVLFNGGQHLDGFESEYELVTKIKYYLNHSNKRKEIVNCSRGKFY